MSGKRVLITGLSSFWGGKVAQALENDPSVEVIIGLDTKEPVVELRRTEFVRTDENYSIMSRLVKATAVDTIVHAGLIVDSTRSGARKIHEYNVIGTVNLLAAAGSGDSRVRTLVVKSSSMVYGSSARDPTWFRESSRRASRHATKIERSLMEVEEYVKSFAEDNPGVHVATLRFANVLGEDIVTPLSRSLSLPLVPCIAGFDPQLQFVEEGDVVRALQFTLDHQLTGVFNVAARGKLPWSEVTRIAGKFPFPLPPFLTDVVVEPFARGGLFDLPPETIQLLKYGRGVDPSKLLDAGFRYRYDTGAAVQRFSEAQRLRSTVGETKVTYKYQADVETFFRRSPAVVRNREERPASARARPRIR